MNDEEVISELIKLDQKEFADMGKAERHGHPVERMRLLELGFSILDDGRMTQFKNLYNKAKGMRASKIMREETARIERAKKELAARAKELNGKITVISRTKNAVVEGTTLIWKCPGCRKEEQLFDLTKMEHEKGYLRINGKDFRLRRRRVAADPTRRIFMTKDVDSVKAIEEAEFLVKSDTVGSDRSVPIGSGPDSPAINRLGNGTIIVFGFQCAKCGFRQESVEIGMVEQ